MDNNSSDGLKSPVFNSRESIVKAYAQQRRDRMGDAIGDYLSDDSVDARQAYEEILSEVQAWIDYHSENLVKAQNLYALMQGERPIISSKL